MSSRPLLRPQQVITNGDMSGDVTSLVTNINMISCVGYTISWTGTPTGTFSVEVSQDYIQPVGVQPDQLNSGTWVAVNLSVPVVAAGTADTAFIDVDITGAAYVRLKYTRTSGTGTLNAFIAGKVV